MTKPTQDLTCTTTIQSAPVRFTTHGQLRQNYNTHKNKMQLDLTEHVAIKTRDPLLNSQLFRKCP